MKKSTIKSDVLQVLYIILVCIIAIASLALSAIFTELITYGRIL